MSEIPEDVFQKAAHLAKEGRTYEDRRDRIARAILAERRRCAAIARGEAHADCDVAEQIATFIEAGT